MRSASKTSASPPRSNAGASFVATMKSASKAPVGQQATAVALNAKATKRVTMACAELPAIAMALPVTLVKRAFLANVNPKAIVGA